MCCSTLSTTVQHAVELLYMKRKLMACLFVLQALCCLVRAVEAPGRGVRGWWVESCQPGAMSDKEEAPPRFRGEFICPELVRGASDMLEALHDI